MTARRSESRLVARPYEPPPQRPPERSLAELINNPNQMPEWPEAKFGDKAMDISRVRFSGLRDLDTAPDPAGGYLVQTSQPREAIEYLGALLIAGRLGAQTIPVTDFSPIPREVDGPTFYWLDGLTPPPESTNAIFGVVNPRMKSGVVWIDVTRLLSVVTGGAADRIITRAFFAAVARGVDAAVFHGSGLNGQPTGIINTPGIDTSDGSTFSLAKAAAMLKAVESGNADTETVGWAMAPDVGEILRQRPKVSGGEIMILGDDGRMLSRPAFVSNSIESGTIFAGDFSRIQVLSRALELLVDRSTLSKQGGSRMVIHWSGEIIATHPAAFAVATGVT